MKMNYTLMTRQKKYCFWRGDLSWYMKSFSEPITRRANKETNTNVHFWEGRIKAKILVLPEDVIFYFL